MRTVAIPTRPRLLYVATDSITVELLMKGQLKWFADQGFEVGVAAAGADCLQRVAEREGVRVFPIPFVREINPWRDLRALRPIANCLREFRPHIVNAGTPKAGLLGLTVARWMRVPSRLYLLRGLRLETTRGPKRWLLKTCEQRAAAAASQVISVSASLRESAVREGLVAPGRIHVLGGGASNGIELERFTNTPGLQAQAQQLRAEWRIPADCPVIGFVGRLTRDKGIGDLAEAFLSLEQSLPNAHLVLVGPQEAGDPLDADLIDRLKKHPRVRFAGPILDVAPCYRVFDVLAFPSYREGLPNVPLEAAASECPVVGYSVTGTVDAVQNSQTGRLVAAGDRPALRDALSDYLTQPSLRKTHGSAGRRFVSARFSQLAVWNNWLDLYRSELRRIGVALPLENDENPAASTPLRCAA